MTLASVEQRRLSITKRITKLYKQSICQSTRKEEASPVKMKWVGSRVERSQEERRQ